MTKVKWGIPVGIECNRFINLPKIVQESKSKVLMEIGVCTGYHAKKMILAALETPGKVTYYGFDLFEDITDEMRESEASPPPVSKSVVKEKLRGIGVDINLFKGFTKDTLPKFVKTGIKPDFIFIDGGHSIKTVENDWHYVKQLMHENTIVVFDDYMSAYDELGWGCNPVVDTIKDYNVEIIDLSNSYMMKKANSNERVLTKNRLVKVWN